MTLKHPSNVKSWITGGLVVLLGFTNPGLGVLSAMVGPGLILATIATEPKRHTTVFFLTLILATTAIGLGISMPGGFFLGLSNIIMAYSMYASARKGSDTARSILLTLLVMLLFHGVFLMGLFWDPQTRSEFYQEIKDGLDSSLSAYPISPDEVKKIEDTVFHFLPSAFAFTILTTIWTNILAASFWARRIFKKSAPFGLDLDSFRLPEWLVWPGIVAGAGALFLQGQAQMLSINTLIVILGLYCIQGAGMLRFFLKAHRVNALIQGAIFLLITLFWYGLLGLTILGVSDVWTNARKISIQENNQGGL